MTDSAPLSHESEPADPQAETGQETPPGFQPPLKARYRPSEAWALRWLASPAR
jgi:hypothetical protein